MSTLKHAGSEDVLKVLPERRPESHKGEYGRLLVIGGGSRYTGAPAMAGLAALRSGVDLVTIASPTKTASVISSFSPDLITVGLPGRDFGPGALSRLREPLERATASVVGPGLGTGASTQEAVVKLARMLSRDFAQLPVLYDADGLKAIATQRGLLRNPRWVVTPHVGEFELLVGPKLPTGTKARAKRVAEAAKELGCVILLKAHVDIIAAPDGETVLNRTGNPGMTVGGTGDVLSGIIGTFLAQGAVPLRAAVAGAFACGRAGDICREEMGYEFMASDLIEKLPKVFAEVRGGA
ncbi:MAG: NAD(P)H-hydrate dehydratase [Candidatus Hadarchaeota archaeon]|nr:NAD(P)H-hydrate dehydratase [Candidatus Hadarchaeota archaeon]